MKTGLKRKLWIFSTIVLLGVAFFIFWFFTRELPLSRYKVGQAIDSLHEVKVYYNGSVANKGNRNLAPDGYNLGIKYQCVEFVKRYYFEHYHHKMPNSYGHAKDFFNKKLKDGNRNKARNLIQYSNPSKTRPEPGDLLVFSGTRFNPFGHVAIVSKVWGNVIEIVQQNPGPAGKSRINRLLDKKNETWSIRDKTLLGWLRKE